VGVVVRPGRLKARLLPLHPESGVLRIVARRADQEITRRNDVPALMPRTLGGQQRGLGQRGALPAIPGHALNDAGLLLEEGKIDPPQNPEPAVIAVILVGALVQMAGLDTEGPVAQVQDRQTGPPAAGLEKRLAVRKPRIAREGADPVTVRVQGPKPDETIAHRRRSQVDR
jgi:hypothetical protein